MSLASHDLWSLLTRRCHHKYQNRYSFNLNPVMHAIGQLQFIIRPSLALISLLLMCSCGVSRISTTEKSAVERALIAESLEDAIKAVDVSVLSGKSFSVKPMDQVSLGPRAEVGIAMVEGLVRKHLLAAGAIAAGKDEPADVIVEPILHFAQLDENKMVIGLPAYPVPIAGSILKTPEIALLGVDQQYGRSKVSLVLTESASGRRIAEGDSPVSQRIYDRWTVLIFFGWRDTDLPTPF
jgi:hypothetical protein